VANNQNGQVSRAIIGAMMKQFFAAHSAGFMDFQIPAQQRPFSAIWTFAAPPFPHCCVGMSFNALGMICTHRGALSQNQTSQCQMIMKMSLRRVVANFFQILRRKSDPAAYYLRTQSKGMIKET
jgi:hypothetical protein